MPDEILKEIRTIKADIAREHDFDFDRLAATLKKHEKAGAPIWDRPRRYPESTSSAHSSPHKDCGAE